MLKAYFRRRKAVLFPVFCMLLSLLMVFPTSAISSETLKKYAMNNILYYNPDGSCVSYSEVEISGATSNERLKEVVREYGEFAMEMQRKYGVPWEVVFAQMEHESGVGTAGIAVSGATNNWLGITGSGDAGTYVSESGRKWAKFSSIEQSIEAWAGTYVLRNGYYDAAFSYLDPNNYDLTGFLRAMISVYAPSSDGNDEAGYVSAVMAAINGSIAEVRAEMGWPSSEELAQEENIQIGGEMALGSEGASTSTYSSGRNLGGSCKGVGDSVGGGSMAEIAVWMSWPDNTHTSEVKDSYKEAMESVTGASQALSYYQDCGHFVATVVRYSGTDEDFPLGGTSNMASYMENSSKWERIENLGNTSNLQPGDILVVNQGADGHIMMYVGSYGGGLNMASASLNTRTANLGNLYFSDYRGTYKIYRYVGE